MKKYIVEQHKGHGFLRMGKTAEYDDRVAAILYAGEMKQKYKGTWIVLEATGEEQGVRDYNGVRWYDVYREIYRADGSPLYRWPVLLKKEEGATK